MSEVTSSSQDPVQLQKTTVNIHCTFCLRVLRVVRLSGTRRFWCAILGHRISRKEFHQSGNLHPNGKEYCHEETTCCYCRKVIVDAWFV